MRHFLFIEYANALVNVDHVTRIYENNNALCIAVNDGTLYRVDVNDRKELDKRIKELSELLIIPDSRLIRIDRKYTPTDEDWREEMYKNLRNDSEA